MDFYLSDKGKERLQKLSEAEGPTFQYFLLKSIDDGEFEELIKTKYGVERAMFLEEIRLLLVNGYVEASV